MLVACHAAVAEHGPGLTKEQAREATSGNLCRCGTYPHVLQAALDAAHAAKGR
jgi:aerobic-type carbon monoxide dehydrogenase small subunit (CoxS/CutS family)